jgi:hypothetical protein
MSAFTSFAVNDREATPVAHTFEPNGRGKDNQMVRFVEPGVVPAADTVCTVSWRDTADRKKVKLVFAFPMVVTETINSVDYTKVLYSDYANFELSFDKRSTAQRRKNLVGMFANMLAPGVTVIDDTVTGLESIW